MKDRAGRVGARGVQQLLADMLGATQAHLHLVGHSYGGKVVLSALCVGAIPRPVESVLLLQPAMSHLCFSPQIAGLDRPGGYRPALDPQRCRQPILTTFSSHDEPLTREFHLFVRRRSDLAELVIAGEAPGRYAALGGYGPALVEGESTVVPANDPGTPYTPDGGARVVGVESSRVISGHSDVSNAWTWWMLLDQVDREG
jgi:pimeloyl-ACP methyl ester carboxylesterase